MAVTIRVRPIDPAAPGSHKILQMLRRAMAHLSRAIQSTQGGDIVTVAATMEHLEQLLREQCEVTGGTFEEAMETISEMEFLDLLRGLFAEDLSPPPASKET